MCIWKTLRSRLGIDWEDHGCEAKALHFFLYTVLQSAMGILVLLSDEQWWWLLFCSNQCARNYAIGLDCSRLFCLQVTEKPILICLGESGGFIGHVIEKSRPWFQEWQKAAYLLTLLSCRFATISGIDPPQVLARWPPDASGQHPISSITTKERGLMGVMVLRCFPYMFSL